jgi:hypothetical protein
MPIPEDFAYWSDVLLELGKRPRAKRAMCLFFSILEQLKWPCLVLYLHTCLSLQISVQFLPTVLESLQ